MLAMFFAADASGGGGSTAPLVHSTALDVVFVVVVVLIVVAVAVPRFRRFAERRKERKSGPGLT
jgi:heme/copper-type cytochrome/quinol oxidase subunit 2